jgi:hypothetical protein
MFPRLKNDLNLKFQTNFNSKKHTQLKLAYILLLTCIFLKKNSLLRNVNQIFVNTHLYPVLPETGINILAPGGQSADPRHRLHRWIPVTVAFEAQSAVGSGRLHPESVEVVVCKENIK